MKTWYAGSGRKLSLTMPLEYFESGSHQGKCDEDVAALLTLPDVKEQIAAWDSEELRQELLEYGAWNEEETQNREENLLRMVWIACGDVKENPEDY